jgi:hypothetical protein
MKVLFAVIIFGGLFPSHGIAQDNLSEPPSELRLDVPGDQWIIKVSRAVDESPVKNGIEVYRKSDQRLSSYASDDGSYFETASVILLKKYPHPLLASNWGKGANTVCLRIFDLELGTTPREFCSTSSVSYKIKGDRLDILMFKPIKNDNSELKEYKMKWKPATADFLGDNSEE